MIRTIARPLVARSLMVMACMGIVATSTLAPVAAVAQAQSSVALGSAPRLINLPRGSSFAVDLPADARDVIVSNPAVAEAVLHSPRRITMIGIAPGETDAVFLDASGRAMMTLRVRVDAGVSALQDTLSRVAPGAQVQAEAVNDSIILTGLVSSLAEGERVAQVARAFVSAPEKVLNMMTIAGSDQVTLKVRVIEVQRSAIKQLGLASDVVYNDGSHSVGFGRGNTYGTNGASLGGGGLCYSENRSRQTDFSNTATNRNQTTSGQTQTNTTSSNQSANTSNTVTTTTQIGVPGQPGFSSVTTGSNGSALSSVIGAVVDVTSGNTVSNLIEGIASTAFSTITGTDSDSCFQAFERVGLIRTLAEPNLTSVNGENASFLAGGEFPIPSGRDQDGTITVEYKPYGVSLAFRPIVVSEGRISMQISVEVSELTNTGGLTLGAGTVSALTLPGLNVRRSNTTVELPSGGSMMIAGLLQENTRQTVDSLPGLNNVPVLGSLFRSRDYLNGETELVVIVEPYIVTPTSPGRMQTPADGLRIASDIQTNLFGQLNQAYGSPAQTSAPAAGWQGPVGYVIE